MTMRFEEFYVRVVSGHVLVNTRIHRQPPLRHDGTDHRLAARLLRNPATTMPAIREVLFAE